MDYIRAHDVCGRERMGRGDGERRDERGEMGRKEKVEENVPYTSRLIPPTSGKAIVIEGLTRLNDRRYDTGTKKRSSVVQIVKEALHRIFEDTPAIETKHDGIYHKIGWSNKDSLRPPGSAEAILILNAAEFPAEGKECDARLIVKAYGLGWRRFYCL